MNAISPPLRLLWALLALVQLSATVLAPAVDAASGGHGEPVAHVESESSDDCGVHHDHLFCQVCRTFASAERAETPTGPDRAHLPTLGIAAPHSPELPPTTASLHSPLGSRAPPRA